MQLENYRGTVFQLSKMKCHSPFYTKATSRSYSIPLNCGKCPYCKKRRVSSWVFRLLEEEKVSSSSHFVTLTYDTRHIPISKKGRMTLNKKDWQLFMKRLRNTQSEKIRYYMAGEYGTKNYRPHYHAIIFNLQDINAVQEAWQAHEPLTGKKSQIGSIYIGTVSGASIAYTAKYIDKDKQIPAYKGDDRVPEFSLMSNKLGLNYLTPQIVKWHKSDLSRMYCTLQGGIKIAMPKYYRDRIFTEDEKEQQRDMLQNLAYTKEQDLVAKFKKLYKNTNFKLYEYKDAIKQGEYNAFFHTLKTRK